MRPEMTRRPCRQIDENRAMSLSLRSKQILALTLCLLAAYAWLNRFMQDDAFISLQYARNLVEGNGLVWQPGDKTEGYTNFLWVLIVSLPFRLSIDPIAFMHFVGIALFLFSLFFLYMICLSLTNDTTAAWMATFLTGTNYSFSAYATGGLETQMQTCLLLFCILLTMEASKRACPEPWRLFGIGVLASFGILTRMDSAILFGPAIFFILRATLREETSIKSKVLNIASCCAPILLIVGAWLIWKIDYYGAILPNTFYAKVGASTSIIRGIGYLLEFLSSYWLLFLPLLFIFLRHRFSEGPRQLWVINVTVMSWLAYICYVGGDFMEFRFLVPIIPLIFCLLAWLLSPFSIDRTIKYFVCSLVVIGSIHHRLNFEFWDDLKIEPISMLDEHVSDPKAHASWVDIGKKLSKSFAGTDVRIAVTPVGAIPFFSRLPAVDMLGLNDPYVARFGKIIGSRPGHQRMARLDYLIRSNVNLIIGHPIVMDGSRYKYYKYGITMNLINSNWWFELPREYEQPRAAVLGIPLGKNTYLLAIYLRYHPAIQEAINSEKWDVIRLIWDDKQVFHMVDLQ